MSTNGGSYQPTQKHTFVSTNDLSAKQYYAVAFDTTAGNIILANAQTSVPIGILLNAPKANETAEVLLANRTIFAIAGGTIAIGDQVTADANGKLITTTTAGDKVIGIALEAAVSGDRFELMIAQNYHH